GWNNIHVICDYAASFKLPGIENGIGKLIENAKKVNMCIG
ncbi:17260_t:CDS:2, partial [Dentiscutata erythropus]